MKLNQFPKPLPHTEARYDSKCLGCGDEILEGDDIYKIDDEWVCAWCKDDYFEAN